MGIVESEKDKIGMEASGVIIGIGSAVNHVNVGDRVVAMDIGFLATRKVVPGELVVRIPDTLSFQDAATMPCVYATVIHSITNVGRLTAGQVRKN